MTRLTLGVFALTLSATAAAAQTNAPPARPAPPQPAQPAAPALLTPAVNPPPARPAGTAAVTSQPGATATAAPVRPMVAASAPADSVKPHSVASQQPPANAVAQCVDGSFVTSSASACSAHRGVLVRFPARPAAPPRPTAAAMTPAPATALRAPTSPANAPAGSTAQCKDGTYLTGTPTPSRCDANGGLAVILPAARGTPPAPAPAPRHN